MSIEKAVAEELTLSYMQAGRHLPKENIVIVARSLSGAVDFKDEDMVHEAFRKARDTEEIPLQGTLKRIVKGMREKESMQTKALPWQPSITDAQRNYVFAWWHMHGTRMEWITDEKDRAIMDAFESDPKNKEFVSYQKKWTHVAAENVMKYGTATMRVMI